MAKKREFVLEVRQNLSDVSQWVALFFLSLFVLLPGTDGVFYNITESKFWYFAIVTLLFIAFAIFVISSCYNKIKDQGVKILSIDVNNQKEHNALFNFNLTKLFLIAYMLWSLISAIFSKYGFSNTIFGYSRSEALLSIWLYAILFLIISEYGDHSKWYMYGLGAMCIIEGILCTMHCFGSTILFPGDYSYFNSSFLGTIGNKDCYSNIAALLIPALFAAYVYIENKLRYAFLPSILMLFFVQMFCDVDCGKIGLIAAFGVGMIFFLDTLKGIARTLQGFGVLLLGYAFYRLFKNTTLNAVAVTADKLFYASLVLAIVFAAVGFFLEEVLIKRKGVKLNIPAKTIRLVLVAIIVVCIVAGLIFVYTYKGSMKLIQEASNLLHGQLEDRMGSNRGYIWKASFKLIKEHPLMGSGPGTYKLDFSPYQEGYQQLQTGTVDEAHNDLIQIACCQGIIGLILYLAFFVSLLVRAIKFVCKSGKMNPNLAGKELIVEEALEEKRRMGIVYIVGIVGFFAAVFFVFSIAIVSPVYWTMAALLEKLISEKETL